MALIIFAPLLSCIISRFSNKTFAYIASISLMLLSSILSLDLFLYFEEDISINFRWIDTPFLEVKWLFYIDQLSVLMITLIVIVSSCVHLYSFWYMSHYDRQNIFISYLSLFTFFMLLLVCSKNLLQLFVGWEGVGVCSYLLIGFWHEKDSAAKAAKKAFLVNRIADVAIVIAICFIYYYEGTLDIDNQIQKELIFWNISNLDLISLLLLIGAMGKSAQIVFHVWLPDAMEGPTPVSALIHSATMVTAGVFLLARYSFLFEESSLSLELSKIVGVLTILFGGIVAVFQWDIKKIVAYSTCSQLGYMFLACGASSCQYGIFHLLTHGFFKALLFLCAGSVIFAMKGEQDIRNMGNLRKDLPLTFYLFIFGSLSIMGIYPFAGFFSKDAILESVYNNHDLFEFAGGILGSFFTGLYSIKVIYFVFLKESIEKKDILEQKEMTFPIFILAFFSISSGFYLMNKGIGDNLLSEVVSFKNPPNRFTLLIEALPMVSSILGFVTGYILFSKRIDLSRDILSKAFYFDDFYKKNVVAPFIFLSEYIGQVIDNKLSEGVSNSIVIISKNFSKVIRDIQTGDIINYSMLLLLILFGLVSFVISENIILLFR